jgi:CubicO group peptidase (beta-lactamase class C family)
VAESPYGDYNLATIQAQPYSSRHFTVQETVSASFGPSTVRVITETVYSGRCEAGVMTPQSDEYGYGAGFWTQRGNSSAARERIAAGMPADSFMALGSQGQYTIVIPSEDLVIVKMGTAYTPHDDIVAVERLVKEIIAVLHADE